MPTIKNYHGLLVYDSFMDRFNYLRLCGIVGEGTFGFNRYLNQNFYRSKRWRSTRSQVIIRDEGSDLGCLDRPISGRIHIHHITPVTLEMIEDDASILYDLNNLICTSEETHRAIHYGDESLLAQDYVPRTPGDTTLW